MVVAQGDVFWADLPPPRGSSAGFRRPVVIVQGDTFNQSQLRTVVCVPLTGRLIRARSPGNVLLPAESTGLPEDSVATPPQILAVDRSFLLDRVGHLSRRELARVLAGIDVVLGRSA